MSYRDETLRALARIRPRREKGAIGHANARSPPPTDRPSHASPRPDTPQSARAIAAAAEALAKQTRKASPSYRSIVRDAVETGWLEEPKARSEPPQ